MISVFSNAFLLSVDSFIATLAVGPLLQSRARRGLLACLFGVCDGSAVLLGSRFGCGNLIGRFTHWAVPLFVLGYGVACLLAVNRKEFRWDPRLVFALPVLMSLDNLVYGATVGLPRGSALAQAAVFGVVSLTLAALGLLPGSLIRFPTYRMQQYCTGTAMLAASIFLFIA